MSGRNSAPEPKFMRFAYCHDCHKRAYVSRAEAKAAAKRIKGRGPMQAYPCRVAPEGMETRWHIGHVPPAVRRGEYDKDEWLGREP